MIQTVTNIDVDLSTPKYVCANLKQGDNGTRSFVIQCRENGIPISIDSDNAYAILKLKKPDGTYVLLPCMIMEDGKVSFTLVDSVTTKPGRCISEIVIYEKTESNTGDYKELDSLPAGKSIATMDMVFNVFPSSIDNCELETTDDFSAMNDLMAKILRDYKWILDENHGIIGSVKTINGRKPDEEGAFFLDASDCQGYIDDSLVAPKADISELQSENVARKDEITALQAENESRKNDISGLNSKNQEQDATIESLNKAAIRSVNGHFPDDSGAVSLAQSDVGLGNVNNTSDADKPISNATQTALDDKQKKALLFTNVPIQSDSWQTADASACDGVRTYYSNVTLANVTSDMMPQVTFWPVDIENWNLSPVVKAIDGGIQIYAETAPTGAITIGSIICWRQ